MVEALAVNSRRTRHVMKVYRTEDWEQPSKLLGRAPVWHENGMPYGDLQNYGLGKAVLLVHATSGHRTGAYMIPVPTNGDAPTNPSETPAQHIWFDPFAAGMFGIHSSDLGLRLRGR